MSAGFPERVSDDQGTTRSLMAGACKRSVIKVRYARRHLFSKGVGVFVASDSETSR